MQTIFKFELPMAEVSRIFMPLDAKILKVGYQDGQLCAWAQLTPPSFYQSAAVEPGLDVFAVGLTPTRIFHIYGTSQRIPNPDLVEYIDTVFEGPYVWHVFERKQ